MSAVRGVAQFAELWERRTTIAVLGEPVDLLGIEDLVRAKKTQLEKDWPMIQRLVEHSYFERRGDAPVGVVDFRLRELRTPQLLIRVAAEQPAAAAAIAAERAAVEAALAGDTEAVARAWEDEVREERRKDREYWAPLKRELEDLRRVKRGG